VRRVAPAVFLALLALLTCAALTCYAQPAPARGPEAQLPAQTIPFRKDEDTGALAMSVVTGLVISVGIGIGALSLLRRYLTRIQQSPGRRLRVIESVGLTPKSALFLVECDAQVLLIGQQGESLAVLSPPPQSASGDRAARVAPSTPEAASAGHDA